MRSFITRRKKATHTQRATSRQKQTKKNSTKQHSPINSSRTYRGNAAHHDNNCNIYYVKTSCAPPPAFPPFPILPGSKLTSHGLSLLFKPRPCAASTPIPWVSHNACTIDTTSLCPSGHTGLVYRLQHMTNR